MDAVDQFLLGGDADATQHPPRHLAEQGLNDIQPGAMLRRKYELESLRVKPQLSLRLLRNVRRVVVQQQTNPGLRRIRRIEFCQ